MGVWATATGRRDRYPKLCSAIRYLIEARKEELTPNAQQKLAKRKPATGGARASHRRPYVASHRRPYVGDPSSIRVLRFRAKKKIDQLTAELQAHKASKD